MKSLKSLLFVLTLLLISFQTVAQQSDTLEVITIDKEEGEEEMIFHANRVVNDPVNFTRTVDFLLFKDGEMQLYTVKVILDFNTKARYDQYINDILYQKKAVYRDQIRVQAFLINQYFEVDRELDTDYEFVEYTYSISNIL